MKWRDKCRRVAEIVGHIETEIAATFYGRELEARFSDIESRSPYHGNERTSWPDYRENDEALAEAREALPDEVHDWKLVGVPHEGLRKLYYDTHGHPKHLYLNTGYKPEPDAVIDLLLHLDIEDEL
jgi:hypothetical protein